MFSFGCFAQKAKPSKIDEKPKAVQKVPDTLIDDEKPASAIAIKSYYVEENINQKFGGHTLTYEVPTLNLINKYDLGPNNTRVITPKYTDVKPPNSPAEANKSFLKPTDVKKNEMEPINANVTIQQYKEEELPKNDMAESEKYLYVYLIKTYERVAEKGYKSVDIFQKLGDAYFFLGEYPKSVKWYEELFKMTSSVDSEYYDRYAHALKKIGQQEKAAEIIAKRNQSLGIAQ